MPHEICTYLLYVCYNSENKPQPITGLDSSSDSEISNKPRTGLGMVVLAIRKFPTNLELDRVVLEIWKFPTNQEVNWVVVKDLKISGMPIALL